MKKYLLMLIVGLCLLGITACSQGEKDADGTVEASTEAESVVTSTISMDSIMHYEVNETLYYTGFVDYGRFEVVSKVDELITPEQGMLYYMEGEVDDLSGGEAGDLSFIKAYKVTESEIARYYTTEFETLLLKKPLETGNKWKTRMIDDQLGAFDVEATIIAIENDNITVAYEPMEDEQIDADQLTKVQLTFSPEQGITEEIYYAREYDRTYHMSQRSTTADKAYLSRYMTPSETINHLYSDKPLENQLEDALFKRDVRRAETPDMTMFDSYLNNLPEGKLYNIGRAESVMRFMVDYTENPMQLVKRFIYFYEYTIYNDGYDWQESLNLNDYEQYAPLYDYSSDGQYLIRHDGTGETRVITSVFTENGIGVKSDEGYFYFSPSAEYLNLRFKYEDETVQDYVDFKVLQYTLFPVMSDGHLIVGPGNLAESLDQFDEIYRRHDDQEAFAEAKYLADYLFEVFVVPNNYFVEDYSYQGGYVTDDYLKAYESFAKTYPESSYASVIKTVVKILKDNSLAYSNELNHYLEELGYDPDKSQFGERLVQIESFEEITANQNRILLNPEAKAAVTVSTTEELIKEIASNKTIYLMPGPYRIPYEMQTDNPHVETTDGILKIKNVSNLTILSKEGMADILTDNFLEALVLDGCEDIQMDGLRIGHLNVYCVGDVLTIKNSKNIELNRLILFGCGYNGLNLQSVKGLALNNSLISDCQARGLVFDSVEGIGLSNVHFYRNGKQLFDFKLSKSVSLDKVVAKDNDKEIYDGVNALFKIDSDSEITITNSNLETSYVGKMIEGSGIVHQK